MINLLKSRLSRVLIIGLVLVLFISLLRNANKNNDKEQGGTDSGLGQKERVISDCVYCLTSIRTNIPSFPGAEGFGTTTPGGRGGKIIEVTSLADDGPGTLREALSDSNPRTIIFNVGGVIELKDFAYVTSPFITIAGQTAPGDGVVIKGAGLVILTHDVIIQHLRIRTGNEGKIKPEHNDAIAIFKSEYGIPYNIVVDHVSVSWGEDELISILEGVHDVTISNSIVSESLNRSRHSKGNHGSGIIITYGSDKVSLHHNLLAHNYMRNPLIEFGGTYDIVNNVIYDWGIESTFIVDHSSNTFINLVGNHFVSGPSTNPEAKEVILRSAVGNSIPKIYESNNLGPRRQKLSDDFMQMFTFGFDPKFIQGNTLDEKIAWSRQTFFLAQPIKVPRISIITTKDVLETVLVSAGATQPLRDKVDQRIVGEVRGKTGKIINSLSEVGGYPIYQPGSLLLDTDHDGMPDVWEISHGLNPNDIVDTAKDNDEDGYTNLEEYLHFSGGYSL